MRITFQFKWIPFIATAIAVALGISLGQWQSYRALEKEEIRTKLAAREGQPVLALNGDAPHDIEVLEYRRVIVKGEFVPDWPIYLDNRPYKGTAGFYLLMPLKIAGSDMHVLVSRGWVKRDTLERTKLPAIAVPTKEIEILGRVRRSAGHVLQLGVPEPVKPKAIVQNIDPAQFAAASKLPTQNLIIEQLNDTQDGLIRDWNLPSSGAEKHRGYAFQWYALAATAFIFFLITGFKRGTE